MAGKNSRTTTTAGRSSSGRSKVRSSVVKSKSSRQRKKSSRSASKPSKRKTRVSKNRSSPTVPSRRPKIQLKVHSLRALEFGVSVEYVAPEPTLEQIQNGKDKGYDAWDLLGQSRIWAMRPDDVLAAAGVIHDELTLRGGTAETAQLVAANFRRDCYILAVACESSMRRVFEQNKARIFSEIVDATITIYWRPDDLNTDVTRRQGEQMMCEAIRHICAMAERIGAKNPYPTYPFDVTLIG